MATRGAALGPGKTTPRLVADLLDYDPRYRKQNKRNLLADPAPRYTGAHSPRKGAKDCHHVLCRKEIQTQAPVSPDEKPDGRRYVVASYCYQCRYHFDISVDYRQRGRENVPCSLAYKQNPLHHLQFVESTGELYGSPKPSYVPYELYNFVCSGTDCPVTVDIKITPPRLPSSLLALFNDARILHLRGEKQIAADRDRLADLEPLLPINVLNNLRAYLNDAKQTSVEPKKIAKRNKKFVLAFADECDQLFQHLGFQHKEDRSETGEMNYFWQLPTVSESNRNFIDDVLVELECLINERPRPERDYAKVQVISRPISALRDLERSLGYSDYPTRSRNIDLTAEEHPYYASLGVVDAFTDELLSWAYDRQRACDPANKPYYLDCLLDLAQGRQSSDLQTKVVEARSLGELGHKEITEAYRFFSLNPNTAEGDDHIVGLYRSRIESAPRQRDEARQYLKVLAEARNSDKIKAVANDFEMKYPEALAVLGVEVGTDSDTILQVAAYLKNESAEPQRILQAIRAVGKERKHWGLLKEARLLESGLRDFVETSGQAYVQLDIKDRHCTDDSVLAHYMQMSEQNPVNQDTYKEALRTIGIERESKFLMVKADDINAVVESTSTSTQPVGLANIGNTCYLNSLLQFYYTINSIREVVTNFDDHRMDIENLMVDGDIDSKKVGGRKVNKDEIVKAQKFVKELQGLFAEMRTASTSSVTPTRDLAELTLFSEQAEANIELLRKKSFSSGSSALPSIVEVLNSNIPIAAPQGPPPPVPGSPTELRPLLSPSPERISPSPPTIFGDDAVMIDEHAEKDDGDHSSDSTLVEMDDSDIPPSNEEPRMKRLKSPSEASTLSTKDDSTANGHAQDEDVIMIDSTLETPHDIPMPDQAPPPVPPRNKSGLSIQTNQDETSPVIDKWAFGSQQDVTEVIGNVTWRLQCAIKASGIEEESGEQLDVIRSTVYGANNVCTLKPAGVEKKDEVWQNIIVYPPPEGVRDIYEALDVFYDLQQVEIGSDILPQFRSITRLPPILQIQIQRTAFDPVLRTAWKNDHPVNYPEKIYMDRYMDSGDSSLNQRRRDAWRWKKRLRKMEARCDVLKSSGLTETDLSVPTALHATHSFVKELQEAEIDGVEVPPSLSEALEERVKQVTAELKALTEEINRIKARLKDQFANLNKYEYTLQTVFIHRGQMGGGHYFIYLYDFENLTWRKYNDEYVTKIENLEQIFHPQDFGEGTPYFLAYVRSSEIAGQVKAIVRDLPEDETLIDFDVLDGEGPPGVSFTSRRSSGESAGASHVEFADSGTHRTNLPNGGSETIEPFPAFTGFTPINKPLASLDNSEWHETKGGSADDRDANGRPWVL